MDKILVAFCEEDDTYRSRFVAYLMEYRAEEIMICAFSSEALFLEEAEKKDFDIVLLGSGFVEMADRLQEKIQRILLLQETVPEKAAEQDTSSIHTVFRYQSMEKITHEILALSQDANVRRCEVGGVAAGKEITGIYSPCRHEMQMPFSLVFGRLMSEKRKVLYLNLIAHSGFLEMFERAGDYDLGDVIVKLRNHRLWPETYRRSVYEIEGISYILPFRNPENLHELSWEDFYALIRFLQEQTDVEMILIDFGEGLDQFSKMLDMCTSVYCPCKRGYLYECQKESFLRYLEGVSNQRQKDSLQFIEVPFSAKGIKRGGDVLRQLIYSEFGDYVRDYFAGQY